MPNEYDRVKHLEMIQSVIARLANEAALIRGWALTVSAVFFAFAAKPLSWQVAAVGLLPVLSFWGLNSYFLREERKYRKLFNRVRKGELDGDPFCMTTTSQDVESWWVTLWSLTLWPFYLVIVSVGALLIIADVFSSLTICKR